MTTAVLLMPSLIASAHFFGRTTTSHLDPHFIFKGWKPKWMPLTMRAHCAGGKHYKWIIFSTKPFCFCLLLIEKSKYVHCTVFENHFIILRAKRATLFTIFLFICFSPKIHVYFSAKIHIISSWRNYVARYTPYVFKMRLFVRFSNCLWSHFAGAVEIVMKRKWYCQKVLWLFTLVPPLLCVALLRFSEVLLCQCCG